MEESLCFGVMASVGVYVYPDKAPDTLKRLVFRSRKALETRPTDFIPGLEPMPSNIRAMAHTATSINEWSDLRSPTSTFNVNTSSHKSVSTSISGRSGGEEASWPGSSTSPSMPAPSSLLFAGTILSLVFLGFISGLIYRFRKSSVHHTASTQDLTTAIVEIQALAEEVSSMKDAVESSKVALQKLRDEDKQTIAGLEAKISNAIEAAESSQMAHQSLCDEQKQKISSLEERISSMTGDAESSRVARQWLCDELKQKILGLEEKLVSITGEAESLKVAHQSLHDDIVVPTTTKSDDTLAPSAEAVTQYGESESVTAAAGDSTAIRPTPTSKEKKAARRQAAIEWGRQHPDQVVRVEVDLRHLGQSQRKVIRWQQIGAGLFEEREDDE
ncbi:hypothetical protein LTS10_003218 [Elasticomyces elasticus]|nr:hypothetical protein LTS10_003218 [Elasticomyces elasticus]